MQAPRTTYILTLLGLALSCSAPAAADSLAEAVSGGQTSLSLRLRHETAEQDNPLNDATARTLRHRLGYRSAPWHQWQAFLETEGVVSIGDEDYNSGPGGNGNTDTSVIADPTGNELNQATLSWKPGESAQLSIGRQRIIYDNARFVGNVGWRQNEQTYDAARLRGTPGEKLSWDYAYLSNVNRIFFDNRDVEGHLLNARYSLSPALKAAAFAYALDFDAGEDSQTLGLRLDGGVALAGVTLKYELALARQTDYADSAAFDRGYSALELGITQADWGLHAGLETLGSDGGNSAFNTPLATLHKFNGWADVFLGTPATGLQDAYLKAWLKHGSWHALAFAHQFDADQGNASHGSELDLQLSYKWSKTSKALIKFASYRADDFGVDTNRLTAEWNFSL